MDTLLCDCKKYTLDKTWIAFFENLCEKKELNFRGYNIKVNKKIFITKNISSKAMESDDEKKAIISASTAQELCYKIINFFQKERSWSDLSKDMKTRLFYTFLRKKIEAEKSKEGKNMIVEKYSFLFSQKNFDSLVEYENGQIKDIKISTFVFPSIAKDPLDNINFYEGSKKL